MNEFKLNFIPNEEDNQIISKILDTNTYLTTGTAATTGGTTSETTGNPTYTTFMNGLNVSGINRV